MRYSHHASVALATAALAFAAACSSGDSDSPLAGLSQAPIRDSSWNTQPFPGGDNAPGPINGTVMAPSAPGTVGDTLANAPRINGATLRVYSGTSTNPDDLGDPIATVTTGADGKFQIPTLANGPIVVTVTPPGGSAFGGVWITTEVNGRVDDYPWWIVLPRK